MVCSSAWGSSDVRDSLASLTQPGERGCWESQVKLLPGGGGNTDSSDPPR